MKKVLFLSVVLVTLILSSCNDHKTEESSTTITDSIQVADTSSVDTITITNN